MLKLLYIGFDGLDPFIVRDTGILKDFHIINSYSPVPWTGPAWTSLNTGLLPKNHGIHDLMGRKKEGTNNKTFAEMNDIYFWDYLNRAGLTCGVMNIPITWPPKVIKSWMVSGVPYSNDRGKISYPKNLLEKYWDDYHIHLGSILAELNGEKTQGHLRARQLGFDKTFNLWEDISFKRVDILLKILKEHPVECVFYQDSDVDILNHFFKIKRGVSYIKDIYSHVDKLVDCLCQKIKAENIVIVSDHGGSGGKHENAKKNNKDVSFGVFGIKASKKINIEKTDECVITDVLPTTLYCMGLNKALESLGGDGRVLYEIFEENILTKEENKTLEEHLRGLGYI